MTTHMQVPKPTTPQYRLTVPSTKQSVKYRPFLVKEEKILLMALESKDSEQIVDALRLIINNCLFGELDVGTLPNFDLEYIFLQLRAKSVNNIIEFDIVASDGKTPITLEINIDNVKLVVPEGHSKLIDLDGVVGVEMRYPVFEDLKAYVTIDSQVQLGWEIIKDCMVKIYDAEAAYSVSEMNDEQLDEWLGDLDKTQVVKLNAFFSTIPTLRHTVDYVDPITNEAKQFVVEGIEGFFQLG